MKLSEIYGDQALETLADILEPGAEIIGDQEVAEAFQAGRRIQAATIALRKHKTAITAICAALDGEDPSNYKLGVFTPIKKVLELFSDPEVASLFISESQTEKRSGSTSENTEE